jgi:hypothetical protein
VFIRMLPLMAPCASEMAANPPRSEALIAKAEDKANPYSIRPSTTGHKSWCGVACVLCGGGSD